MRLSYGLDFGTTNSTICIVVGGKVKKLEIDPTAVDKAVFRSVICVTPELEYLFGKPAVDNYLSDIAAGKGVKKNIVKTGKMIKVTAPSGTGGFVPDIIIPETIEVEESPSGRLFQALKSALSSHSIDTINVFGTSISIEELIGKFLSEMKKRADDLMGQRIDSVVIGRPVQYVGGDNKLAIKRMKRALETAGFKDYIFEFEPVGAALDYGIGVHKKQIVLVFDFGGGTLDLSIFKLPEKQVLTNSGLAIGGDYFNSLIFRKKISKYFGSKSRYSLYGIELPRYIFNSLENWYEVSKLKGQDFNKSIESFKFMSSDIKSIYALSSLVNNNLGFAMYEEIERVKIRLSSIEKESYVFNATDIDINEIITKSDFEKIIWSDLEDIKKLISDSLINAGVTKDEIDSVVTTGGSSQIPSVRNLLFEQFGEEKVLNTDAFTSVASGLAIRASEVFK